MSATAIAAPLSIERWKDRAFYTGMAVPVRSFEMQTGCSVHGVRAENCCGSGGDTEKGGNKVSLADRVTLGQPPDSTLVDHVHGFDSLQGPPRAPK